MPNNIFYKQQDLEVAMRINDDFSMELLSISPTGNSVDITDEYRPFFAPFTLQCSGEETSSYHGYCQHAALQAQAPAYYEREEYQNNWGKKVEITLHAENGLCMIYHLQFFVDISIVRSWITISNQSENPIGLEYVSSFMYFGIGKNSSSPLDKKIKVYLPYNSWCCEAQWKEFDLKSLGFREMSSANTCRYSYGNSDSWSCGKFLPMGVIRDSQADETYFWQIESSSGWHAEYSTTSVNTLSVALSGPSEQENHWWKNLNPGESFTTVPAAFGVVKGDFSQAISQLTLYRRAIRRLSKDCLLPQIVFNDYMNCLDGDPTEEKELPLIDLASQLGCEYYCIDAGWYDKDYWWDKVGEWKESAERFPNGLKKVFDYVREKGMKPGIWIELEVMGTKCPLAKDLPDNWFFLRHGKRHIDKGRFLLDFRNPSVREYAWQVIERLIDDYGIEFFKIDYNITSGIGTEYLSDSFGDGLLEHTRCLAKWYRELYDKYPHIIIENCGSGGQRMDYHMLSMHSLQSVTDQTNVYYNAAISANASSAVAPEQAGIWVYPYENDREHVIFNVVNGILNRPYISGRIGELSSQNFSLLEEGISLYKEIRSSIRSGTPFYPLGLADESKNILAYGILCPRKAYLAVWGISDKEVSIPLSFSKSISSIQVIYPHTEDCQYHWKQDLLSVTFPKEKCARLFEIQFEKPEL